MFYLFTQKLPADVPILTPSQERLFQCASTCKGLQRMAHWIKHVNVTYTSEVLLWTDLFKFLSHFPVDAINSKDNSINL